MRRPLSHPRQCPHCEGKQRELQSDWFGEEEVLVMVTCEGCDGTGMVADCCLCDEELPLSEAENGGYVCVGCTIDAERGDQLAEMNRVTRRVWS